MLKGLFTDRDMIENLLKVGTMLGVSAMIRKEKVLQKDSLYILAGFAAYHLVSKRMIPRIGDYRVDKIISTTVKVGTMMVVSTLLAGKKVDKKLGMGIAATVAGFSAYDLLVSKFVPTIPHPIARSVITDAIVVVTMSVVKDLALGKKINKGTVMATLPTIAGFAAYDIVAPMIL